MEKVDEIVLHSYPKGRGVRIMWFFKLLEIPYTLKAHNWIPDTPPPEAMLKVHTAAHSPVVEVKYKDGSRKVLAESGYIIDYFVRHFDPDHKMTGQTPEERDKTQFFLHFSEGSFITAVLPDMYHRMAGGKKPHPYFDECLPQYREEVFSFMDDWCKKQFAKDQRFLVGEQPTVADMVMLAPCEFNKDEMPKYPNLKEWADSMEQCSMLKEAREEDAAAAAQWEKA
ncbi:hypothetical protein DICA3_E09120 [Diutina catenulata]